MFSQYFKIQGLASKHGRVETGDFKTSSLKIKPGAI